MDAFLNFLATAGSVLFVFVALGFCIFSHELGHFLAAKMLGLHIDAFSLGFRPFWRKKYKGVEYRLGYLPFGGYVELPQIDTANEELPKAADGTELRRATARERVITAVAGPLFNIVSGLLIGCIIWAFGMPQDTPKMREIAVRQVPEASPEYRAGLRKGDVIVKLNGKSFNLTWGKFVEQLLYTIDEVELEVRRDGKKHTIRYMPAENPNAPANIRREKINYPFFTPLVPLKIFPEPGSIAEKAGLRSGDIILNIADQPVLDYLQLQMAFNGSCGKPLKITVQREGKELDFTVIPEEIKGVEQPEIYLAGVNMTVEDKLVKIASITPGSAAAEAKLKENDILAAINGKAITKPADMQQTVKELKDKPFELTVKRGSEELKFTLAARKFVPATIGISMAVYDHPNPIEQFVTTCSMSWNALRGIATGIGNKLGLTQSRSSLKPSHMSGPLGIGMVLFTSVRTSPMIGIYMMVVISFALAIFNLLPLPVLDGGHIMFGLIEMIFRKPVPVPVVKWLSYIFVTLLIGLMVFVTIFDSGRLYHKIRSSNTPGETR
ncbi:MAG: site-2 protease family protein [Lentisphaeria bacterium]|nr:site-2 protease family protein [Lentisphaeria bacterium]